MFLPPLSFWSGSIVPRLAQVATRAFAPSGGRFGTTAAVMCRTVHFATDNITGLQVKFPAWCILGGQSELGNTGTTTFTASIEYPAGTFTQVTWNSSASAAVPVGNILNTLLDTGLSDVAAVTIPKGTMFWIRNFATLPANGGLGCTSGVQSTVWTAQGEACNSTSATDQTLGGTVTNGASGACIYPLAIVAMTLTKSFAICGDSRTLGTGFGAPDVNGNQGQFAPSLGIAYGYINLGCGSDTLQAASRSYFQRRNAAKYCTHVSQGYGINDLNSTSGNRSAAQFEGNLNTFHTLFDSLPLIDCTVYPTSSGSWGSAGSQTINPNYAALAASNVSIRTKPSPVSAVVDLDVLLEDQSNAGLWISSPTPPYTADGLHANPAGYSVLRSSGAINGATLAALTAPPRFTIVDFPTLATWWDTSDMGTLGPQVTTFFSRNSTQQLIANAMTYSATAFNGGPAWVLNGTTSQVIDSGANGVAVLSNNAPGLTLALLCSFPSLPSGLRGVYGWTITGANNERAFFEINSSNAPGLAFRRLDTDATTSVFSTTPLTTNTVYLFVAVFDPSNTGLATLYLNGVQVCQGSFLSTGNFSATTSKDWVLATLNAADTAMNLREADIFTSALSANDLLKLQGEIAWRQGVNTLVLPMSSPYFNGPPKS